MLPRLMSPAAAVILALIVSTSFVGPDAGVRPATPHFEPWIDTSDREEVLAAYRAAFDREIPALDWTGTAEQCQAGDSSDALRRETLVRISWYRAMAGVPADVIEDPLLSDKAQAAALMMSVEGELTHHPESDFACFSAAGQQAAANSNLYLGRTGPSAIDGYIEDPGDRNIDVGHRSTILHPPTGIMGIGHVAGSGDRYPANALWVFDDDVFARDYQTREPERFVAWPPRGFVPARVVYPRWSFALQEADFTDAVVTMTTDAGEDVPLEVVARISKDGEIPSSVLVWEPDVGDLSRGVDRAFTITIANVVAAATPTAGDEVIEIGRAADPGGGPRSTYVYRVVVIDDIGNSSPLAGLLAPISDATSELVGVARLSP
ncbi:MAG: hypothetical protein OER95_00265 [Acidimicrobiia bacterium]|nr:hypothetical protein [Acidimicrobiia bacterium]